MCKKTACLIFLVFLSFSANAQNSWTKIVNGIDTDVYSLNGSFLKGSNRLNHSYLLLKIKFENKKNNTVTFKKAVVYEAFCKKGEGKIELYDLDEKNYVGYDFIFNGGNVISGVAEAVCSFN